MVDLLSDNLVAWPEVILALRTLESFYVLCLFGFIFPGSVFCAKSAQIAKRVLAEQLVLERGHLRHQDLEHLRRLRDQNAAMERAEERLLVKLGYDQDDWFLTNLYDWAWNTTDEDLRIKDSTENEWMDWWQA